MLTVNSKIKPGKYKEDSFNGMRLLHKLICFNIGLKCYFVKINRSITMR